MKKPILLVLCLAVAIPVASSMALAGPIENACNRSKREASNRRLCDCIQQVANQTLRRSDQGRAASFFKNPDKAHQVWMSKRDSDDAFWERYKNFGAQAEAYCGG